MPEEIEDDETEVEGGKGEKQALINKKRKATMRRQARLIKKFLDSNYLVWDKSENKVPYSFISRDLFNIADYVAVNPALRPCLIQLTSKKNVGARVSKITTHPHYNSLVMAFDISVLYFDEAGQAVVRNLVKN